MEQIEKGGKCTYGDIPVRQGNYHEKAHIKLSKHFKMRRVATRYMSHCLSKKCKSVIQERDSQYYWRHIVRKLCLNHLFHLQWNLTSIVSQFNFEKDVGK